MSKEWPDVPALVEEARGSFKATNASANLIHRLADALEMMHDLYRQADTSAVNLIAEKDELQARIGATMALDDAGLLRAPTLEADGNA